MSASRESGLRTFENRIPLESTDQLDQAVDVLMAAITRAAARPIKPVLRGDNFPRRVFILLKTRRTAEKLVQRTMFPGDILRENTLQRKLRSALTEFRDEECNDRVSSLCGG